MRYALLITQHCNLACTYCYIGKRRAVMSLPTAARVIDFIFARTPADEKVELGFFGGEPLLAFDRLQEITALEWKGFAEERVGELRERLSKVGTVGFDELMELSNAVDTLV